MSTVVEATEPTAGTEEVQSPTAEVPGATAGEAPSAPVAETGTTESAAALATRPRGPDGRFIKADGTEATVAEQAAMEAAPPATPPAPVAPTPPAPTVPSGEPFVFKADGQRLPIPGATISANGHLTIPVDQVPAIRQLLAEGVTHRGSWRKEREAYTKQIESAGAVEAARAEKYNKAAVFLWDRITDPNWLDAAVKDPREVDILRREIGIELQRADLTAPRKEAPASPEVDVQQLEVAAKAVLTDVVEELMDTPQAKAVYPTPEARAEAIQWYQRHLNSYAVEVDGEVVIDTEVVNADFQDHLKLRRAQQQTGEAQRKAAEFNARRNLPPVPIPPTVNTRTPTTNGKDGVRTFKDAEEYRKAVGMG